MKGLQAPLLALRRQLQGNRRLQAGLAIIVLLLLAFAWQWTDSLRVRYQELAMQAEIDLRRIQGLRGDDAWFERAAEAGRMRDALQAEIPQAGTPGLAQAALQSWLRERASSAGNPDAIRISMDTPVIVDGLPGVVRARAALSGAIPPRQVLNLVRQIEGNSNLMVIETITLRSDENTLFNLTLNAYYRVPAAGDSN